ncbi:MAG TPA: hypothetical protein VFD59_02590 [Nocardioidaceae bacterium]|nr:hypothetical protein [Nocardioidaceae bacterium]
MDENLIVQDGGLPAACTLPSIEQPLRQAEFDDLFAHDVLTVHQTSPREMRLDLRPEPDVAARAARLAAKEAGCCSFFSFDLSISDGSVVLVVSIAPGHEPVLAALVARARVRSGAGA